MELIFLMHGCPCLHVLSFIHVVVKFYPWFKFFPLFQNIIITISKNKEICKKLIKFKPRIKFNNNINTFKNFWKNLTTSCSFNPHAFIFHPSKPHIRRIDFFWNKGVKVMNVSLYSVSITLVLACSEGLLWGERGCGVCSRNLWIWNNREIVEGRNRMDCLDPLQHFQIHTTLK